MDHKNITNRFRDLTVSKTHLKRCQLPHLTFIALYLEGESIHKAGYNFGTRSI